MRAIAAVFGLVACGLSSGAFAQDTCADLAGGLSRLDIGKGKELVAADLGKAYRELFRECDLHDTFNGKPLPAKRRCSTDPNRVGHIKKFPDGTILFRAKMSVDADGSPFSKAETGTNQAETSLTFDKESTERFFNAEEISFIVLPGDGGRFGGKFGQDSGVGLGDLGVVMKGSRCSFAIVADSGPAFRLGEGSMKAHADLGNPQCAVAEEHPCIHLRHKGDGVGIENGVTYLIFPHTRPKKLLSQTISGVVAQEAALKAKEFFDKYSE